MQGKSFDEAILTQSDLLFLALVRAGLWESEVQISSFLPINWDGIYQIASNQRVIGLVASGMEHVTDVKITKPSALPFMKSVISTERKNEEMNVFINSLFSRMRQANIHAVLLKGQGVAQCYDRPLWRAPGDIDLLFDRENYYNAKGILTSDSESVDREGKYSLHLGMSINDWRVEMHGSLRVGYH